MDAAVYDLTQQTQAQLFYATRAVQPEIVAAQAPLPSLLQVRQGYAESPAWFMIQAAEFDPEPLTIDNIRVRDIYASKRIVQALLEMLTGERWLARVGEAYHLTEVGRDTITQLQARSTTLLNTTKPPLLFEECHRLEILLKQIVKASLQYTEHPSSWSLAHSHNRAPATEASTLAQLNHYFSDLNAFRDDAHMTAWIPMKVPGHFWEAFSLIYTGQATSAEAVFDQLFYRGYAKADYADALQQLMKMGWLRQIPAQANQYQVTAKGLTIHGKVENATNAYFYEPWSTLSQADIAETQALLQTCHDQWQALATVNQPS